MSIFSNHKHEDYTIIIGCGRLGANLANALSDEGANILIIDGDEKAFNKLSPSFGGITLHGDATDFQILNNAEIGNATTVVVVTNDDNTNILIAQIAKEIFNIKHVIARLYDPEKECVYHEFGIDTICPAILSAKEIDKILHMTPAGAGGGKQ